MEINEVRDLLNLFINDRVEKFINTNKCVNLLTQINTKF